nr:MlaD family protein [uncultured Albidiferax sp.]
MNYPLVGAFVLLLGAALVAGLLWLVSGGAVRKQYDLYLAIENESVAGLNLNAPVKYNGVEVGRVRDIHLDATNPERVQLTFAIEKGTPIKEDTVAVLKTQGLTGIAYVELGGGTPAAPLLRAKAPGLYPEIRTKPSLSARLENVLTTAAEKLDRISNNVDALLSNENRLAISQVLADMAVISRTIAGRKDSIDKGLANAARTFQNTAQASAQLGLAIARIGPAADAVQKMGLETALTSQRAAQVIDTAAADLARVGGETLPEVQRLLGEMNVLSGSLRRLSEQTERNPASLLWGRSPVPNGPGESTPQNPQVIAP